MARRIWHFKTFVISQHFQSVLKSRAIHANYISAIGGTVSMDPSFLSASLAVFSFASVISLAPYSVYKTTPSLTVSVVRRLPTRPHEAAAHIQPFPHRGRMEIRPILHTPHFDCPTSSALAIAAPSRPPLRTIMGLLMSRSHLSVPDYLSLR